MLLLNAAALRELGPLDERYFLYSEETDWQRRARSAGWGIRVARVDATHVGGGTGGDAVRREAHFYASAELYIRRHHGAGGWAVYRAATLAGAVLRGAVLPGERGAQARRRARLFARGPLRALRDLGGTERTALRLVVVSLEPWDEVWRRNQYLIDGLLRSDPAAEVLFVEPPADPLHALRRRRVPRPGRGLRVAPGYEGRLRLLQPTKLLPRALGPHADRMLRSRIRRAIARLGWRSGVLWINDPGAADLAPALGWPVLYDITDDWVEAARGDREHARLERTDGALLATAETVVVCSPQLLRTKGALRPAGADPVRLVPNAVDRDRYRTPVPRPHDLPAGPVALYAGTLHEDRLDVELVVRTADALSAAGGHVVLMGPDALEDAHHDLLAAHPGVVLAGARPRGAVPGYLQHADVLLVPHVVTAFTDSLDPIKLYEYLAVGRPIVSTPVAGFRDDPRVAVADRSAFPETAVEIATAGRATETHERVPSWEDRVAEIVSILAAVRRP